MIHKNLIVLIDIIRGRFLTDEIDQTYIATIPMFRYYSLLSFTLCLLSKGVTTIVLSKFDTYNMLSAVQNYNVTFLPSIPLIFILLAKNTDGIKKRYDLSSLWYILTGRAPLCKEGMDEFMEKYLTVKFLQGYALTKSNGAGASRI